MQIRPVVKTLSFFLVISLSSLLSMSHNQNFNFELRNDSSKNKNILLRCCNRSFTDKDSLRGHMMIHNICSDCGIKFNSFNDFANHVIEEKTKQGNIHTCCNTYFLSEDVLESHIIFHRNSEILNQLIGQYNDFAEEKNFAHECCNNYFTDRAKLRAHMLCHYICMDCVLVFGSVNELIMHIKNQSTHGNKLCQHCNGFYAKNIDELNNHKRNCRSRIAILQSKLQQCQNASNIVKSEIKQEIHVPVCEQKLPKHEVTQWQSGLNYAQSFEINHLVELFSDDISKILS